MTSKTYSISIATDDSHGGVEFSSPAGRYTTKAAAMREAKKTAGRGAKYVGDGLSVRYSGPNGTVYVVER